MSGSRINHFSVLGLSQFCTDDDVRKAYLKLAKEWHPDVNKTPGATEKFKLISEAYELLKDEVKRSYYRASWQSPNSFQTGNSYGHSSSHNYESSSSSRSVFSFRFHWRRSAIVMFGGPFLGLTILLTMILNNNHNRSPQIKYEPSTTPISSSSSQYRSSIKSSTTVPAWFNQK
jgi:curved DNA-binding protein CbpA